MRPLARCVVPLLIAAALAGCASSGPLAVAPPGTTQPKLWCDENVGSEKLASCLHDSQAAGCYYRRVEGGTYERCRWLHYNLAGLGSSGSPNIVRCHSADGSSTITDASRCHGGRAEELPP